MINGPTAYDPALGREHSRRLRQDNFAVDLVRNGENGLHQGSTGLYAAAVLELGLSVVSGIAVLTGWRAAGRASAMSD